MTNTIYGKAALKSASALLLALAVQPAAFAQDNTPSDDTEFLGTLTLGESKREVQTDTATALTIIDQEEADELQHRASFL